MTRIPLRLFAALALVALTMFVVACGSSDEDSGDSASKTESGTPAKGKKGGTLKQLGASDVDFLDPGQTYYTGGFQVIYATQTPLYIPKPPIGDAEPGLAEGKPEISDDKKSVTVTLKKGVKFAPPVNREIQAKDVKYAFERAFTKNVPNQYTTYFNFIEGAPSKPGALKDIPGIVVDDPYKITFKLTKAQGAGLRQLPRDAGHHAGPEGVRGEVRQGVAVDVQRERRLQRPVHGRERRAGQARRLQGRQVDRPCPQPELGRERRTPAPRTSTRSRCRRTRPTPTSSGRQVLSGEGLTLDANPPAQVLKRVVQRQKDQLVTLPGGGFRWFPLNRAIKPLDDLNVRKAILAAFDREAAIKARGGSFVGKPGTHFIPPGIGGFEEAGGEKGPGFDFLANPKGDMAVAEKYMKAAGYASGKYDGSDELLMVTANVDPGKAQAEVAKAQLEKLGFKIRLRTVPQDAVYTEWCQQPAKKVAVCGGAGWFKDYNDPQSMLEPTFKGSNFSPGGRQQQPRRQLQDAKIDKAMDDAALLEGDERNQAWGEIDKMITAHAPAVPFIWDNTNLIHSKNVNAVGNAYMNAFDLSYTSIK